MKRKIGRRPSEISVICHEISHMATIVEMAVARLLTIDVAVSVTTCCTPLTSELNRA